jgi:hypothetical protein
MEDDINFFGGEDNLNLLKMEDNPKQNNATNNFLKDDPILIKGGQPQKKNST